MNIEDSLSFAGRSTAASTWADNNPVRLQKQQNNLLLCKFNALHYSSIDANSPVRVLYETMEAKLKHDELRARAAVLRLKQSDIIRLTGMSSRTVAALLNGGKDVSFKSLQRLCDVLDIEFEITYTPRIKKGKAKPPRF